MSFTIPYTDVGSEQFKGFLMKDNLILIATAITIGMASTTFIKSFVYSILMPAIYFVIGKVMLQNVSNSLYKNVTDIFGDKVTFHVDTFIKDFLVWFFILIGVYLIMDFLLKNVMLRKYVSPAVNRIVPNVPNAFSQGASSHESPARVTVFKPQGYDTPDIGDNAAYY